MAGNRLVKKLNEAKIPDSELTDLMTGIVTSLSPLSIRFENSYTISTSTGQRIITSSLCRAGTPGGEALRVNDGVHVLRCGKGQTFFILEKISYATVRHCECGPIPPPCTCTGCQCEVT